MFPDGPDSAQLITNEAEYLFDGKGSHFDGGWTMTLRCALSGLLLVRNWYDHLIIYSGDFSFIHRTGRHFYIKFQLRNYGVSQARSVEHLRESVVARFDY